MSAFKMYDAVAEASGVAIPAARPAAIYGEVAKTVSGIMKQSDNPEYIGSGVSRLVKQAGVDTTVKNAIRDGAKWAWVPHGDTCSFCIMLASNGWQEASKKVLKGDHAEHVHANCDCTFAIRFDSRTNVAGYDPDALYEQYMSAEGDTWQEKLNSMRREQYAANPEKYRAQKRAAYERRKGLSDRQNDDRINQKFIDRLQNHYENEDTAYTYEEIEKVMCSSPIGADAAEYIDANGYSLNCIMTRTREN